MHHFQKKKIIIKNNQLHEVQVVHQGRKIPLKTIRTNSLEEHKKYMRLESDADIEKLLIEEIKERYDKLPTGLKLGTTRDSMIESLKAAQRTRHMKMWHDGSQLIDHPYLLHTVSFIYDSLVYYTNEEYLNRYGIKRRMCNL